MKFHKFTFISSSRTDKERFNSRGQHQWKFIGAKEEKSSSIGLGPFIVLKYQYGRRDVVGKRSTNELSK